MLITGVLTLTVPIIVRTAGNHFVCYKKDWFSAGGNKKSRRHQRPVLIGCGQHLDQYNDQRKLLSSARCIYLLMKTVQCNSIIKTYIFWHFQTNSRLIPSFVTYFHRKGMRHYLLRGHKIVTTQIVCLKLCNIESFIRSLLFQSLLSSSLSSSSSSSSAAATGATAAAAAGLQVFRVIKSYFGVVLCRLTVQRLIHGPVICCGIKLSESVCPSDGINFSHYGIG